jgi:hypothetical protein
MVDKEESIAKRERERERGEEVPEERGHMYSIL